MKSASPLCNIRLATTRLAFTASIAVCATGAHAATPDRFLLGEVTVTARAADNSLIGGAEIEQSELRSYGKQTLDQALDLVPGTAASNAGGSRNERLVFVRGFDRFQTMLSIDGVRVFLPADNRIDFARFLTADLAKIQISKGYVSVLDGPGGLGGAINLVTRRPDAQFEAEAVVSGSLDDASYNGHTVSGRVGTRQEAFYLQASGAKAAQDHWNLSNDFSPTVNEDGGERNNSDSDDYRFNLKAGFTPNDNDEYALNYTQQSGAKNAPYHVSDTLSIQRYWTWPYWSIDSLYFLSHTQFSDSTYLRTRVYANSFDNALFAYDEPAQTTQSLPRAFRSYYEDRAYGARAELGTAWTSSNTLRTALHYRHDKHVEWQAGFVRVPATGSPFSDLPYTEGRQTTNESTYSIALEDTQQLGDRLDLIAGISYDWTKLHRAEDVSVFAAGSTINQQPVNYPLRNTHAWNGQAALNYRATDTAQLHVNISSRVRFPTLFERFSSRMGTAVPNPDIGPERATSLEIGGSTRIGARVQLAGAVFYSRMDDALLSVPVVFAAPINTTLNQTRNVGAGDYYGAEVSTDVQLSDAVMLGGNYTYLRRKFNDPTNATFRPTGVPEHKAFIHADWQVTSGVNIVPNVEWNTSRWTVTSAAPSRYYRTGSTVLLNLAASWTVNNHFDVLLGGRNLLDRNYQLADGFPEQGRNFYASVRAHY